MDAIRSGLGKLVAGFLYGIGFVVALAIALAVLQAFGVNVLPPRLSAALAPRIEAAFHAEPRADQFHFSNPNSLTTSWGDIAVLGTVVNEGSATGPYLQINADLFDKDGQFLYQCMTRLKDGLRKNEKTNFMIECRGAPKEIASRVTAFKVYVHPQP